MADVEITYNNSAIVTMSSSGTEILETEGTFLTDDITIEYTKPTPTLQSKSVNPTESAQTVTADSGYDGLSQVNVGAISSSYVGSNVPRQAAQTITPTTSDQTIASGQYLTGVQTIKGDANLLAENIKKDVVIFGITGTYEGDTPSGYTVTVSLTNPRNPSYFSGCVIKSCSYEYDFDGEEIGTITSATGSTTVTVTTEHIYVEIKGSNTAGANITSTGNIEEYGYAEYPIMDWFVISGNGTITFDNVNYDG